MKKIFILISLLCLLATSSFAQTAAVLKGTIIDLECLEAHKEDLANFMNTHAKECALSCAYSGYAIYVDGKAYKFDAQSNAKIEEFLKNKDSKLAVVVTVQQFTDDLTLVSIENQK
jgi:biotin synthase-related radical SAM superfamily protein